MVLTPTLKRSSLLSPVKLNHLGLWRSHRVPLVPFHFPFVCHVQIPHSKSNGIFRVARAGGAATTTKHYTDSA